jgi:conjugal transfer ATP-binding protein TraC
LGILDNIAPKPKTAAAASSAPAGPDAYSQGLVDVRDIIAPSAIEVDFNHMLMGTKYFRTYFASGYPRFVTSNWLSPLINFEKPIDISTFYYPVDSGLIMKRLERKIGELEATINIAVDEGKLPDPTVKVALQDALDLQNQIASGTEKFFHFGLYMTVRADDLQELEKISKNLESTMAAIGVVLKIATLQQEQGFKTTTPIGQDKIYYTRNMDTTSIATTFPFVSSELTMAEGVLYGINKHNKSLVIFDRYKLPNANMVVFATSGAGKSYMIKLEAVRSLMFGIDVIIIDPEREYEKLTTAIGGEYLSFSQDGAHKLNPFELSGIFDKNEDELRYKILSLHGLVRLMGGGQLTPEEDAILDRALVLTYAEKGINPDPSTHGRPAPLLEDLYKILLAMAEPQAKGLATKLEKYVQGSAAGVFNQQTNISLNNSFTVFSIRDLSEELRPIAMYVMLEYIWTKVRKDRRKRLLIIDEAWWMMQYPDAAKFLFSLVKRARKYGLGLTTITQDVEDFLGSDYGKAIVSNSALQVLLKQNPVAVDKLKEVFYLTEGEKRYILSAGIGEGIFFAGAEHVAIQVLASENEHNLITTNINEVLAQEAADEAAEAAAQAQTQTQAQPAAPSPQPAAPAATDPGASLSM